jgi:hypothetical protein
MCGGALLVGTNVRYVVSIDVRAAYDVMETTREEIEEDHAAEMKRLLARTEGMTEEELQDSVHRAFRFDLCPRCQKEYLKKPLP